KVSVAILPTCTITPIRTALPLPLFPALSQSLILSLCVSLSPQIVYDEGPLYVFAKSDDVRKQWIKELQSRIRFNHELAQKFHPRFWLEGEWLCCQQTAKAAPGCRVIQSMNSCKVQLSLGWEWVMGLEGELRVRV
uniref:PH domain-containing protein n=1 Tax=Callorhinchus milii TaxID=7868 RepID=A0A4W3GGE7_CALMI